MGEIFRFKKLIFKIWFNDYEPPHVHIHAAEAVTKINLDTLEIINSSGFSEKDLKTIQQQIFKRRSKVFEKWEKFHD